MVILETYTFLKGRQDNKWCSLKKFDFSNRTKKIRRKGVIDTIESTKFGLKLATSTLTGGRSERLNYNSKKTFLFLFLEEPIPRKLGVQLFFFFFFFFFFSLIFI